MLGLVGIDVGTSGVRALAITETGEVFPRGERLSALDATPRRRHVSPLSYLFKPNHQLPMMVPMGSHEDAQQRQRGRRGR
jgi:hypothetical protein